MSTIEKKYSNSFMPKDWVEISGGWDGEIALLEFTPGVQEIKGYGSRVGIFMNVTWLNPEVKAVKPNAMPFFSLAGGENMKHFSFDSNQKTLVMDDHAIVAPNCNFSAKLWPTLEREATRLGKSDLLSAVFGSKVANLGLLKVRATMETQTRIDADGKKKTYKDEKGVEKDSFELAIKEIHEFLMPSNMPGVPMAAPAMQPMPQAPQAPINPGAPKEKTLLANFLKSQGKVSPLAELEGKMLILSNLATLLSQGADVNIITSALNGQRPDVCVIANGVITF
jgi:hypothetical protein